MEEARTIIRAWQVEYNTVRPHSTLGNRTPAAFKAEWLQTRAPQAIDGYLFRWTRNWVQVRPKMAYMPNGPTKGSKSGDYQ
jgi:Integrase core domain